jgi:hypothetical protein
MRRTVAFINIAKEGKAFEAILEVIEPLIMRWDYVVVKDLNEDVQILAIFDSRLKLARFYWLLKNIKGRFKNCSKITVEPASMEHTMIVWDAVEEAWKNTLAEDEEASEDNGRIPS